jgi:iron complex transport system substrate-binding protein
MTAQRPPTPPSWQVQGSWIPRLLALLLTVVLAACTAAASPTPPVATIAPSLASTASPSPSASPSPTQPPYPLNLRDDEGTTVAIASPPKHIVSLSPANTEIVWTLGAGGRQVAGTDADDFPAAAVALPDVVTFTTVDVEKIVSLQADLVLAAGDGFTSPDAITRLRSLGIPVLVVYAADVPGVLADIELIGTAIGERPAALDLTAAMRARIDQIATAAARTGGKPRTFYELDATNGIFGPADASFPVGVISLAGGDPITTGSTTVFQISLERLVAADPEVILLGDAVYGVTPEIVTARPGWGGMTAVRMKAIYPVDDIVVTRPGPRLADGILAVARAIHPDLGL